MRLFLVIHGLGAGGAERVMTLLAEGLATRGHEVYLLTLAPEAEDFFRVGSQVHRISVNLTGDSSTLAQAIAANARRIRAIRKAVRGVAPQAVLSFTTHVNVLTIMACAGLGIRVVISERIDPSSHVLESPWRQLRSIAYRHADALVAQTREAADWFRDRLRVPAVVTSIVNPVVDCTDSGEPTGNVSVPFLLGAGRLVHQKGFDILIRAFQTVATRIEALNLVIAGEGAEAATLHRLAAELGVADRVTFPGRVRALPTLMKGALCFVLSSRYEGFPNVLLEALAMGVPIVSTSCRGGPREILADGQYGLLVPPEDPEALAEALLRVATDQDLRRRLVGGSRAAVSRYQADQIVERWEHVLIGKTVSAPAAV